MKSIKAATKKEIIENLHYQYAFCKRHKKEPFSASYYAGCPICVCKELTHILSEIDYLIHPLGKGQYKLSIFDTDYDPNGVLERLKKKLKKPLTIKRADLSSKQGDKIWQTKHSKQ